MDFEEALKELKSGKKITNIFTGWADALLDKIVSLIVLTFDFFTGRAIALLDKIVSKEGLIKSLSQQIVARNNYVNKLEKCESLAEFAKMNDEFLGLVKGLEMQGVSAEEIESNAIEMQSAMDKLSDITETVESSMEAAYVDDVSNNQRIETSHK